MDKKKKTDKPHVVPGPVKEPDTGPPADPEEPLLTDEDPDIIPDEETAETPPYEAPPPGEGP